MKAIRLFTVTLSSLAILLGARLGVAQQAGSDAPFIRLQTSINALMVDLVDHAAHEIWDASYAEDLSEQDWQVVEQHAIQLIASGTLISLPGTGVADRGWTLAPAWQRWAQQLTDGALAAEAAVESADQDALEQAGGAIVATCEGCHAEFKPDVPTEGIGHVPHYDE